MKRIRHPDGVEYLQFGNLSSQENIIHAFSTRIGGVSRSFYASMNLGFNRGDPFENVAENYRRFCQALDLTPEKLVFTAQTHSTFIRKVGVSDLGEVFSHKTGIDSYDGIATDEPGVFLATLYADCVPLYFYDPVKKATALSHAGWRGTLDDMAGVTVRFMEKEFNSSPGDILMGIGPSIGKCCFEVGEDVSGMFRKLPDEIVSGAMSDEGENNGGSGKEQKCHIDLQLLNRRLAVRSGVPDENIETADICTECNSDWLFSHRASGGKRGSLCAVLGIKVRV